MTANNDTNHTVTTKVDPANLAAKLFVNVAKPAFLRAVVNSIHFSVKEAQYDAFLDNALDRIQQEIKESQQATQEDSRQTAPTPANEEKNSSIFGNFFGSISQSVSETVNNGVSYLVEKRDQTIREKAKEFITPDLLINLLANADRLIDEALIQPIFAYALANKSFKFVSPLIDRIKIITNQYITENDAQQSVIHNIIALAGKDTENGRALQALLVDAITEIQQDPQLLEMLINLAKHVIDKLLQDYSTVKFLFGSMIESYAESVIRKKFQQDKNLPEKLSKKVFDALDKLKKKAENDTTISDKTKKTMRVKRLKQENPQVITQHPEKKSELVAETTGIIHETLVQDALSQENIRDFFEKVENGEFDESLTMLFKIIEKESGNRENTLPILSPEKQLQIIKKIFSDADIKGVISEHLQPLLTDVSHHMKAYLSNQRISETDFDNFLSFAEISIGKKLAEKSGLSCYATDRQTIEAAKKIEEKIIQKTKRETISDSKTFRETIYKTLDLLVAKKEAIAKLTGAIAKISLAELKTNEYDEILRTLIRKKSPKLPNFAINNALSLVKKSITEEKITTTLHAFFDELANELSSDNKEKSTRRLMRKVIKIINPLEKIEGIEALIGEKYLEILESVEVAITNNPLKEFTSALNEFSRTLETAILESDTDKIPEKNKNLLLAIFEKIIKKIDLCAEQNIQINEDIEQTKRVIREIDESITELSAFQKKLTENFSGSETINPKILSLLSIAETDNFTTTREQVKRNVLEKITELREEREKEEKFLNDLAQKKSDLEKSTTEIQNIWNNQEKIQQTICTGSITECKALLETIKTYEAQIIKKTEKKERLLEYKRSGTGSVSIFELAEFFFRSLITSEQKITSSLQKAKGKHDKVAHFKQSLLTLLVTGNAEKLQDDTAALKATLEVRRLTLSSTGRKEKSLQKQLVLWETNQRKPIALEHEQQQPLSPAA